jgi:hypothetical protein
MNVIIQDKFTRKIIYIGSIILRGANYAPSEDEYFEEAWKTACEDGLVESHNRSNYLFTLQKDT